MQTEVFTTGYPRSGSTWLNRLLSGLLDSPLQTPEHDAPVEMDYCRTGQGGFVIRKTHWQTHEWDGSGKMVFIQRDPRDVAVSAMYYLNFTPCAENLLYVIWAMVEKNVSFDRSFQIYHRDGEGGGYDSWVRGWSNRDDVVKVRYEWLHEWPIETLWEVAHQLGGPCLAYDYIREIVDANTFEKHQAKHPHSLRKGIVGDWKNYFRPEHGKFMTERIGLLMLEQEYIDSLDWWRDL